MPRWVGDQMRPFYALQEFHSWCCLAPNYGDEWYVSQHAWGALSMAPPARVDVGVNIVWFYAQPISWYGSWPSCLCHQGSDTSRYILPCSSNRYGFHSCLLAGRNDLWLFEMGVFWLKHIPATFSVSPVPGKQNGMLTQVNTMFLNSFFFCHQNCNGIQVISTKETTLDGNQLKWQRLLWDEHKVQGCAYQSDDFLGCKKISRSGRCHTRCT